MIKIIHPDYLNNYIVSGIPIKVQSMQENRTKILRERQRKRERENRNSSTDESHKQACQNNYN